MIQAALLFCFFVSGAGSLVLETVWVRAFSSAFGHTTLAVSAVLAAFMGGLGVGAALGGRLSRRLDAARLPATYAVLEAGAALAAALTLPATEAVRSALLGAGILELAPAARGAIWLVTACVLVGPPSALMGATLPVLTDWLARLKGGRGVVLGRFYAANAAGGAVGALAAAHALLPALGNQRTLAAGCLLLTAAAAAAWVAGRRIVPEAAPAARRPQGTSPGAPRLALALILSGAGALAAEVAFTRALAPMIGTTVHAFAMMLAVLLLGLSAGAALYTAFGRGRSVFPWLQAGAALGLALGAWTLGRIPYWVYLQRDLLSGEWWRLQVFEGLLCGAAMFPAAVCLGASLPAALDAAGSDSERAGADAGFLYGANTAGNVIGAVLAGLWLVPAWGPWAVLTAAAAAHLAAAVVVAARRTPGAPSAALVAALVATGVAVATVRPPDPRVSSSGMFMYAPKRPKVSGWDAFLKTFTQDRLLFHEDGAEATVDVLEGEAGSRVLRINGKIDASSQGDMPTQFQLAYLPWLLHPGWPGSALVVGLGSGVTAGSVAALPGIARVLVLEIEPAVIRAAAHFSGVNRGALTDPRVERRVADARQVLDAHEENFDLIISEPSNPWIAGISALFTREAFTRIRDRLAPGGVVCQWIHGYDMGIDDFRRLTATFLEVFPQAQMFRVSTNGNDYFLVGSAGPWRLSYARMAQRWDAAPAMKSDMDASGVSHPAGLFDIAFVAGPQALRAFSSGAAPLTDDRRDIEFTAPRRLHRSQHSEIAVALHASRIEGLPVGIEDAPPSEGERSARLVVLGETMLGGRLVFRARQLLETAVELDPRSARALVGLARALEGDEDLTGAEETLRRAVAAGPGEAPPHFALGSLLYRTGRLGEAGASFDRGLALAPGEPMASLLAGRTWAGLGNRAKARRIVEAALRRGGGGRDIRQALERDLALLAE